MSPNGGAGAGGDQSAPETRASFARRFLAYQSERFPLAGFIPLIGLFTFASATFSSLARGAGGAVEPRVMAVGAYTSLVCFLLLRVLDEHKDAEDDRRYRPELPVPRGLVTLAELRRTGFAVAGLAVLLNAIVMPVMLLPLAIVAAWAALMTREFFVRRWLRAHMAAYLLTHMAIMPLIDAYTTGLDWLRAQSHPPAGVLWFLGVTFANGVLIEVGRKLRAPGDERPGVDTYTHAWGLRVAPLVWLIALAVSAWWSVLAARSVSGPSGSAAWFAGLAALASVPAMAFLARPRRGPARWTEAISQLWPATTYVMLGVLPLLLRAWSRA